MSDPTHICHSRASVLYRRPVRLLRRDEWPTWLPTWRPGTEARAATFPMGMVAVATVGPESVPYTVPMRSLRKLARPVEGKAE